MHRLAAAWPLVWALVGCGSVSTPWPDTQGPGYDLSVADTAGAETDGNRSRQDMGPLPDAGGPHDDGTGLDDLGHDQGLPGDHGTVGPDSPHPADWADELADPCAQVTCDVLPPSECIDDFVRRRYHLPGECADGQCSYPYEDAFCELGCQDGICNQCGDGVQQISEECDGADFGSWTCESFGFAGGELLCDSYCLIVTDACARCGNGVAELDEQCDGNDLAGYDCLQLQYDGGTLSCSGQCFFDVMGCYWCGNHIREPGEQCDASDLGDLRCDGLGFLGGTLACTSDCTPDTTACHLCGNGTINPGEACDGGDLGGQTCLTMGYNLGGTLGCAADCQFDTVNCVHCDDSCVESADICLAAMDSESDAGLCDQLDNDCDGAVDEGCVCDIGQVQPCFLGPSNRRDLGTCTDGTQTCENKTWGPCVSGIWPALERCDGVDNDCDGCTDDDLCCVPPIDCSVLIGDAEPFVDKHVVGSQIYLGADATWWQWSLTRGPCDIVLNKTSFTMNGQATTLVEGANLSDLTLNFQLSGSYTLTLRVQSAAHGWLECSWVIHVVGPGLRVELCWDTTGMADIDLHLGKMGSTAGWFYRTIETADCFYSNCKNSGHAVDWGYPMTGGYYNPRLDIDNISNYGVPENINLDNPNEGDMFRVLVHYFSGSPVTHPVINIYCGGTLKGSYGVVPQVIGFDHGCGDNCGDGWKVLDIQWHGGSFDDSCDLFPIVSGDAYVVEAGPFVWP